jgi:hypothetical protein
MEQIKQIHEILLEMFSQEENAAARQIIEDMMDMLNHLRYAMQ